MDEFLEFLPEDEYEIVTRLRSIVLGAIPECVEKLAYNVPYYKRHRNICFIWPASVPWGKVTAGVNLGFTRGTGIPDPGNYLLAGDRKHVAVRHFRHSSEIDPVPLKRLLYEAVLLDEKLFGKAL